MLLTKQAENRLIQEMLRVDTYRRDVERFQEELGLRNGDIDRLF
jgi:hypothetical protein